MDWLKILFGGASHHMLTRFVQARQCIGFARDLGLVMQKACFGCLPKGKYIEYQVYTKHFSREELCPFLDAQTLAKMDTCTQVSKREMHCHLLDYTIDERVDMSAALTLAVTVHFEGSLPDGQQISLHMENKRLIASLVINQIHWWKLVRLTLIQG